MKLFVEVKEVYGNTLIYPKYSDRVAKAVKALTGKKTIDTSDISNLSVLGVKVEVMKPELLEKIKNLK